MNAKSLARPRPYCLEQRLRFREIEGVETFGKPPVNRREEIVGFGAAALVPEKPSEARSGPQFPEFGILLHGDNQGLAIPFLGGLNIPLPSQQPTLLAGQLSREPALPSPFDGQQSIIQQDQTLIDLAHDLTGRGEEPDVIRHIQFRPGFAVRRRTAAQQRYPLGQITIFEPCPPAKDRSQCTPLGETLLAR